MNSPASRSSIATRAPEVRRTRNRISIQTPAASSDSASQGAEKRMHPQVLFIAGESLHTELIRMVLSDHGVKVHAIAQANSSSSAMLVKAPDVVLLDWDSEGVNGEAVLRGLRSNPETRRVPVILLMNHAVPEPIRRELAQFGVHWILEKPIVPLSLPKLIQRTIESAVRNGDTPAAQFQRSALLVECGETASGMAWKAVW